MDLDSSSYNSISSEPFLGYFAFNSDNNVIQYQKYYLKLSSTFSNVGGCINIVFTIAKFLTTYFSSTLLFTDMIKEILFSDGSLNLENSKKQIVHLSTSSKSLRMKKLNQEKPTPPSTQQFKLAHFYFPSSYVKKTM